MGENPAIPNFLVIPNSGESYLRGLFRPRSTRGCFAHIALPELCRPAAGIGRVCRGSPGHAGGQSTSRAESRYILFVEYAKCQISISNIQIQYMYYVWSVYLSSLYKLTIAGGTDGRVKLGSRVWSMCCPHESSVYRYLYAVLYCARCILQTGAEKYVISVSKSLSTQMGDYEIAVRLLGR